MAGESGLADQPRGPATQEVCEVVYISISRDYGSYIMLYITIARW